MVRALLILVSAVFVLGAGVWFTRHFDPEVARLVQARAKQRLEKEHITYLAVEASGREVTVVLPPGTMPSEIARAKSALATLEGASSVDVHAFGEGGHNDDRIGKMLPKERLTAVESATGSVSRASNFPGGPEAAPATAPPTRRNWNLSIGRSQGGRVEYFDLGATQ